MSDLNTALLKTKAVKTALNGDWNTAAEINLTLVKDNPSDIDALNRLAMAYGVLGKVTEAKKIYQKVFKLDPLNSIALRNCKKLKENCNSTFNFTINNNFIEETGKTKIVELVNVAQTQIIENLRTGQIVDLSIKRSRIFVLNDQKQYIGVLPDDIGRRLIKLMNSGNKYEAYVKSTNPGKAFVFLKEMKRCNKYKNLPSFITTSEWSFDVDKASKTKVDDQEDED